EADPVARPPRLVARVADPLRGAVREHLEPRVPGEQRHAREALAREAQDAPLAHGRHGGEDLLLLSFDRHADPCAAGTAATIRSGVIGTSSTNTPSGRSASLTALATAVGAMSRPPSPAPLTPYSVNGEGVSWCSSTMSGTSCIVGSRYSRS